MIKVIVLLPQRNGMSLEGPGRCDSGRGRFASRESSL